MVAVSPSVYLMTGGAYSVFFVPINNETMSLNYRQKTLLGLVSTFGNNVSRTDFQKYLFLFTQEFEKKPSFEFVPYKFGAFSFQSTADRQRLIDVGALVDSDHQEDYYWQLREGFSTKGLFDEDAFSRCYAKYSRLTGDDLLREVYHRYPYYAIRSEIAERVMDAEGMRAIQSARPTDCSISFFTIGYEGSSIENYLNRLIRNNIKTLVDVRFNPFSHKYGFSKNKLSKLLQNLDIAYVNMPELGITGEKRQALQSPADYERLFDSYEKNELKENSHVLQNLFDILMRDKRVAITCFEAVAGMCHRGRVVKALAVLPGWKYKVCHI